MATHQLREALSGNAFHCRNYGVEVETAIDRALQEVGAHVDVLWIAIALSVDRQVIHVEALACVAIDE